MKKSIFPALKHSGAVFILLINVKMAIITIVAILTFMSRIEFMLSWIEHEKLGPE